MQPAPAGFASGSPAIGAEIEGASDNAVGARKVDVMFDFALGGAVTLFIAIYLVYALLRPERF